VPELWTLGSIRRFMMYILILLWWIYLFLLFILTPYYLIRGVVASISKDIQKHSRAKYYFVVSGILVASIIAIYLFIGFYVRDGVAHGQTFL
jgi:hypothetical protein